MRRRQQQSLLHLVAAICLLILIFTGEYSTTTALLNILRPTYRHSNELAQFERYESLIGSAPFFKTFMDKWSRCVDLISINVKARGCKDDVFAELMQAAKTDPDLSINPLLSRFVRGADETRPGYFLPSCNYSIDLSKGQNIHSFSDERHGNHISFSIFSRSCTTTKASGSSGKSDDKNDYRGGASFDIHASNIFHIVSCEVRDNFDDSYSVFCPLSKTLNKHHNSDMSKESKVYHSHHSSPENSLDSNSCACFAMSIILDYEHFDAFSEFYMQNPPLNHVLLDDSNVCACRNGTVSTSNASSMKYLYDISDSKSTIPIKPESGDSVQEMPAIIHTAAMGVGGDLATFTSSWVRRISEPKEPITATTSSSSSTKSTFSSHSSKNRHSSLYSGNKHLFARNHIENCKSEKWGNFDYVWTGLGNTFPLRSEFKAYFSDLSKHNTHVIGESHFRYTWDLFYYLYYGGSGMVNFARKHGSVAANSNDPMPAYIQMLFATDAGDYITSQPCVKKNSSDPARVLVVQAGAWDLQTAPLRQAIRYSNSFNHLIEAILTWSKNNCSDDNGKNKLIYVSIQPYPRCAELDLNCEHSRGYRNIYAITALDQWVLQSLLVAKDWRSDLVYYINAMKITAPKMRFMQSTCLNHFLCHESDNIMHFSAPGLALAGEVLKCMMLSHPSHDSSSSFLHESSNNINCMSLKDIGSPLKKRQLLDLAEQHNTQAAIQFSRITEGDNNHQYFKIEGNILRGISDKYTYEIIRNATHYNHNSKGIVPIIDLDGDSMSFLSNYPELKTFSIPSREEGKIYKPDLPYMALPVYTIDKDGLKNADSMWKDLSSKASAVRTEDLLDIQSAHGCNYVV